jgi:tRNA dimethylallyltransferase
MLQSGAIEEVEDLLKKIGKQPLNEIFKNYPIFRAIGAKEIALYLDERYSFDEMQEKAKQNSRHYAKRQITWIKHQTKYLPRVV